MIARFRRLFFPQWFLMGMVIGLVLALLAIVFVSDTTIGHGGASAAVPSLGSWSCDPGPASVAFKEYPWSNSTGGVGSGLPAPALMQIGNDYGGRQWDVWLYPSGETHHFKWDEAIIESTQPGGLPTGRINPTGNPTAFYHDNDGKGLYTQWGGDGGGPAALYRVRFPCHFAPP